MVCRSKDDVSEDRDAYAETIASVVDARDTPDTYHLSRLQLQGRASSNAIAHDLKVFQACIDCYETVVDVMHVHESSQIMRGCVWPPEQSAWTWQYYIFCVLSTLHECDGVNVDVMAANRSPQPRQRRRSAIIAQTLDVDLWRDCLSSHLGRTLRSPAVAVRLLLNRSVYGALPAEVREVIVEMATRSKTNACLLYTSPSPRD